MDEIPTPPPAPSNRGDGPARVVAIALSDIQAGIAMDKEEMGERLAYNSTMLSGRFDVFEAAVWRFIDEQALIGPVQCLNFLGVGDWIENHQLRIGARKRTDLTLTQSTIVLQRLLAQFIARTRARYPALPQEWDILPGNHDRIGGGKPGDEMSCDNWAVIIGEMLKLQFRDEPAVRIFVHMEEYAILRLGASRIMLHHGHGIQGTALLPWYGIDRRVSRWEGFHRQQFQYVVLGHFHNPAMWQTTSGCKVYINGAWFDSTAYGASLGLATPAQQTAFAIEAEAGIVYTRELPLSPPLLDTPVSERGFTAA